MGSRPVIAGVSVEVSREAVWVRSQAPMAVLTSAPLGAHLRATRHVVNMHVRSGYRGSPAPDLLAFGRALGIREPFVGLMTAVSTDLAVVVGDTAEGLTVVVAATVGLGVPFAAGADRPGLREPSTINVIAVVDGRLPRSAAVNGVITVTEAKVSALAAAGVRSPGGHPATGTVTDAVALAWTGRGPELPYLGPGTTAGWLLARAVRRAVGQGIVPSGAAIPGRPGPSRPAGAGAAGR